MASRTAAEALLLSSQRAAARRIDALVRHSSDALVLVDDRGRLLFASAPADQLFQQPLSRQDGDDITAFVPSDERERWSGFLAQLRDAKGQTRSHTWRIARNTPEERLIETIGQDLRTEAAVGGIVLNSRDVTERATLEDRLRQAQKLEVAGRLAGGVAHDFNNVLTAVMAGTELAQLSLDPQHPAQQDLAGIEASAQRGAALTRRLLAFVRQEPVPAQRFDLRDMLLELEPLLQRLVGDANQVSVRVDPTIGTVVVDRTELEHIIFNLVANARDAMGEGGSIIVDASVETRRGDEAGDYVIRPGAGRHARVEVIDRGHGMSDDVRRRMFDPFFTQKSGGRGTGLGLIGVRPLVEGADGGLQVTSSPSDGTRVSLWLPAAVSTAVRPARTSGPLRHVPAPVSVPAFATSASRATSKGRILLVEDEISVREQLTRLLDALGYTAIPVTSAADARLTLESEASRIDAVVSDVMMPGETGLEFAEWIRSTRPTLPILLISGHTGTALDRAARQSEELGLLRKPFAATELDERLAAMLAR
jgi:PAS domain S-box-containing protein